MRDLPREETHDSKGEVHVGKTLLAAMKQRGLSAKKLAAKLGQSSQSIHRLKKMPRMKTDTLVKYANLIGVSPEWVLAGGRGRVLVATGSGDSTWAALVKVAQTIGDDGITAEIINTTEQLDKDSRKHLLLFARFLRETGQAGQH